MQNLKITLLLLSLLWSSFVLSAHSPCINRTVRVIARSEYFKKIEFHFMLFSSLPFQVTRASPPNVEGLIAIDIGYDWPSPQDVYPTPSSMELAERVFQALKPKIETWGIQRMEAFFDPRVKC